MYYYYYIIYCVLYNFCTHAHISFWQFLLYKVGCNYYPSYRLTLLVLLVLQCL